MSVSTLSILLTLIVSSFGQQVTKFWQFDNEAHHGHYHHQHDPNQDHDHSNHHHATHTHQHPVRIVKTEHVDTEHRTRTTSHVKPSIEPVTVYRSVANPIHVHEHHPNDARQPHLHDADPAHSGPVASNDARQPHLHDADPAHSVPVAAPPGYPSSDFVKYFAQYTSRGGAAKEAPHSYYRAHNGHLNNFNVEPEHSAPQAVKAHHVGATPYLVSDGRSASLLLPPPVHLPPPTTVHLPQPTTAIAAGNHFHSRIQNGQVQSPSGNGPHYGFYYGDDPKGGRLLVGHRQLNF